MTIDASLLGLYTPQSSTTDPTTSLLSTLYGNGTAAVPTSSGTDPGTALDNALKTEAKSVAAIAKQPQVARDLAAFRTAVAQAKTPSDLLSNPAALKVLLTANGLADQAAYPALAKKALLSNTAKPSSLASKLTNPQFLATAKTFDFANKGLANLKSPAVLDTITNGYAEVQWRRGLDANTPGLSNAIDFRMRAKTIKTVDQVLGDPTFREVITTALGIPKQIAFQSLTAQEHAVGTRIDIAKFGNPKFVDQFTKRYLVAAANTTASTAPGTTDITSLFA